MWNTASVICVLLLIQASAAPAQNAAEDLKVLPAQIDGVPTQDLMNRYLQALVDRAFARWTETYEKLETPEQIAAYQQRLRGQFIEAIGGLPKRTPLNAKVVAVVRRDGFHVEKVLFESRLRSLTPQERREHEAQGRRELARFMDDMRSERDEKIEGVRKDT